ncbi:MAG TPA: hypothetical protein VGX21_20115 [Methylomirabilota bacterium]|jgi:hypothetical protein|nr:hypothetical protein [Methylomirabilota bacterium]
MASLFVGVLEDIDLERGTIRIGGLEFRIGESVSLTEFARGIRVLVTYEKRNGELWIVQIRPSRPLGFF